MWDVKIIGYVQEFHGKVSFTLTMWDVKPNARARLLGFASVLP